MTDAQMAVVARIKSATKRNGGKSKLRLHAERRAAKPVTALKRPTPASSEPARTARVRYMEPPTKSDGNPFFAFRVRKPLGTAFRRFCKSKSKSPSAMLREFMSKVTGVAVADDDGDEGGEE